jgi:hypothetical protein
VASTLRDRFDEARTTATEAAHDAQGRLSTLSGEARVRGQELAETARGRSEELGVEARDRAKVLGTQAKHRAQGIVTAAGEASPDAAQGFGDLVGAVVSAVAAVPLLLARLLRLATVWVDRATEQGRTVAARVEPPKSVRRSRRARTAAVASGAFGIGFALGWVLHERLHAEPEHPYVEPGATDLQEVPSPEHADGPERDAG